MDCHWNETIPPIKAFWTRALLSSWRGFCLDQTNSFKTGLDSYLFLPWNAASQASFSQWALSSQVHLAMRGQHQRNMGDAEQRNKKGIFAWQHAGKTNTSWDLNFFAPPSLPLCPIFYLKSVKPVLRPLYLHILLRLDISISVILVSCQKIMNHSICVLIA